MRRAALTLALLSAFAGPAGAQVPAPSLVEEDLPVEEKRPAVAPVPPEPPPPPVRPPPPEPPRLRAIEPVRSSWADVLSAWRDRRTALREQEGARAAEAARRLLDLRRELAIENMHAFAAAEAREADRALRARLPAEAVEYAELAVQLAPDLGDAWVALARARIAKDPSQLGPATAAAWAAARAVLREPHTVRAFLGDVLAAAMAALAAAGALTLLLLFLRHARVFLHDFAHLPVIRAATKLQAFFLALVLLGLPLALGLGPWLALFGATLGAWLYCSGRERVVAAVALAALSLLPLAAAGGARLTAWTGSLAEEIFELEHGSDGGERAARLAARADLPPPAFLALGRWHKRRGDLGEAMRWYDRASEVGGRTVEVMVNVGNVKFLRGDVEGAKAAWLGAADRGAADVTALAAAHYNLAKLYLRQSALDQSNQARRRALQMDEEFVTRFGSDDDFGANRWILDVPVEHAQIQALAAADGTPRLAGEAVQSRLGGAVPPWLWPLGPLGLVALLGLLTPLLARLRVSAACDRCGRPACPRCESLSGPLCGQCVNVFVRKGVVDARDQLRKEVQVRRHERLDRWTGRALALLSGGGGHLWRGEPVAGFLVILGMGFAAFVLVFWRGLVPPPHPSPYILGGKLAAVGPLGLVLYALAVRDAFRRD